MRQKLWGIRYRAFSKIIHKFGYCKPRPHPGLTEKNKTGWIVPSKCDWCGSSKRLILNDEEFKIILKKEARYSAKITKLFGG